ncbi:MAG: globin [Acidimicrobiaceae bacterium]|nr:globin [Acidimicrobiaceae bacterium]
MIIQTFFLNGKTLTSTSSLFDRVGGITFFERLVDCFYEGVVGDPVLLVLYTEPTDLTKARQHLTWFLAQYWGGPMIFNENRGDPKLRMRHMPFHIGPLERDRWLVHMLTAVNELSQDDVIRTELTNYFVKAAEHLRNDTGLPISPSNYPR